MDYIEWGLFLFHMNLETQSIETTQRTTLQNLIQFSSIRSMEVFLTVVGIQPFGYWLEISMLNHKIKSLVIVACTSSTKDTRYEFFEFLLRSEKFQFFSLQQEQTQKQMFYYIQLQGDLEYISVPKLSRINSDCIVWNNQNESLGVGSSGWIDLSEVIVWAVCSKDKNNFTENKISDFRE